MSDQQFEQLEAHRDALRKQYDTVIIITSKYNEVTGETETFSCQGGNYYTILGTVHAYLDSKK